MYDNPAIAAPVLIVLISVVPVWNAVVAPVNAAPITDTINPFKKSLKFILIIMTFSYQYVFVKQIYDLFL